MTSPDRNPERRATPLSPDERQRLAALERALIEDYGQAQAFVLHCNPVIGSPEPPTPIAARSRIWAVALTLGGMITLVVGSALVPAAMVAGVSVILIGCGCIVWGVVKYFSEPV